MLEVEAGSEEGEGEEVDSGGGEEDEGQVRVGGWVLAELKGGGDEDDCGRRRSWETKGGEGG